MAEVEGSPSPSKETSDALNNLPPATINDGNSTDIEHENDRNSSDGEDEGEEEEEEEDEDEEPRLKYATLTKNLGPLYKNGDATSACFVVGDKMIVGTHNGNINVLLMPSLQSLRVYRAHNATVTSLSISPYPAPLPVFKTEASVRISSGRAGEMERSPVRLAETRPPQSPRQVIVPKTTSNDIFIASSSLDGNVCVSSLIDTNDIQLRNFSRPVQAVALSPRYKADRTYLSGGQAGNLILTVGGQKGKSTNASITGAAATASSWLGSMGLGSNTGTDRVLHGNEGAISSIKWSLSGKYVLWVTEEGVKIMYSHLHAERAEAGLDWKRISHISRPNRSGWDDMAGVWKARAEWVDRTQLETDDSPDGVYSKMSKSVSLGRSEEISKAEEVIVGWGDTVWLIKVLPGNQDVENGAKKDLLGRAEIAASVRFNDCIISGVSMYTTNLILVLAHMEKKPGKRSKQSSDNGKKGRPHRHNGLEPELRIVDILSKEEVDSDTLQVSRFETLTSSDYHMSTVPPLRIPAQLAQKSYLESIGGGMTAVGSGLVSGVETVGQGMYDATMYGPRRLGMDRLFSGSESIRSGKIGLEGSPSVKGTNYLTNWIPGLGTSTIVNDEAAAVATMHGSKIFIFSPYDCIVGIKRNLADRLQWLLTTNRYREAWELLDENPQAVGAGAEGSDDSTPMTPSKASSLAKASSMASQPSAVAPPEDTLKDFFADSFSVSSSQHQRAGKFSKIAKEKRRIGGLWIKQLLEDQKWEEAAEVAAKVLDNATQWDEVLWKFIKNKKFDEISSHIPTFQITPTLSPPVYEIVLGHYAATNRRRFKELLDQWPSDLFEIRSITSAIEDQLDPKATPQNSEDWRLLQECLAKLSLDNGNYKEALKCYVKLQDAEAALSLIKEHHLVDAVADDIPSFVLIRIPSSEISRTSQSELQELSADSINLLVEEATHGVVGIDEVVSQLQSTSLQLFLYFYMRALWKGDGSINANKKAPARGRMAASANLAIDEGHILLEQYADTAVQLFAEYDRDMLMEFLHGSTAYTFEKAVKICEQRHLIEELVYLLSKTGAMKKALFLIIDELNDVSKAIDFAKEQDDDGLWNDFLDYSMSRPHFISGLLAEVGTAINPIELVKRIPAGLEIEGLKDGLQKMIREYDLQDSISSGVAKVLSSEVAGAMDILRRGRRQGIKFELNPPRQKKPADNDSVVTDVIPTVEKADTNLQPGHCAGCGEPLTFDEKETLIGLACGHVYHVSHFLHEPGQENEGEFALPKLRKGDNQNNNDDDDDDESPSLGFVRSIAPKVTNARLLKDRVEDIGGCRVCQRQQQQTPHM